MSTLNENDHIGKIQRTHRDGVASFDDLVFIRQLGPGDMIMLEQYRPYTVLSQPYMVVNQYGEWKKIDNNTPQEARDGAIWQVDLDP